MIQLDIKEKDVEEYLYNHPDLASPDHMPIKRWLGRQLHLPTGIIDLIGIAEFSGKTFPIIIEVKNVDIKAEAITQVSRYRKEIVDALNRLYDFSDNVYCAAAIVSTGKIDGKEYFSAKALDIHIIQLDLGFGTVEAIEVDYTEEQKLEILEQENEFYDNWAAINLALCDIEGNEKR